MGCETSKVDYEITKAPLSEATVKLIQESWNEFLSVNDVTNHGMNLIIRLFTQHPEIKYLWKFAESLHTEKEMRENGRLKYHGKRILETIGVVVKSLNNFDVVEILLVELGSRHCAYGTEVPHFSVVKEAFMFTFKEALGAKYTQEIENAWDKVFEVIVKKMLQGMNECAKLSSK